MLIEQEEEDFGYRGPNRKTTFSSLKSEISTLRRQLYELQQKYNEQEENTVEILSENLHELKTPVNIIRGYCELLSSSADAQISEEKKKTYVDRIYTQTIELEKVLQNYSLLSKSIEFNNSDMYKRADLNKFLIEVSEQFEGIIHRSDIHLVYDFKEDVLPCEINSHQFRHVIENLLQNAIRFTPPGGKITLSTRTATTLRSHALIAVKNTGRGIPESEWGKIFQRHYTITEESSKKLPSGLGLSISKKIVNWHDGKIWIESEKDKETSFYVSIPTKH